jgi:hypothetical protein
MTNLNWWGLVVGFLTVLLQHKAAVYEIDRLKSGKRNTYKYSAAYKRAALQTLEIAVAITFTTASAYWNFIFPEQNEHYKAATAKYILGDNYFTDFYWYYRSIVLHSLPFFLMMICVFMTDIIFLETDWWLISLTAFFYTMFNYAVTVYLGLDKVYYMDWGIVS